MKLKVLITEVAKSKLSHLNGAASLTSVLLALSVFAFSGCANLGERFTDGADTYEIEPSTSISIEGQPSAIDGKVPARLYFADTDNDEMKKEIRYINRKEASKSLNNLCKVLLDELMLGPDPALGVSGSYLGCVVTNGDIGVEPSTGVATIDLSSDFLTCAKGDETDEKIIIYSIVNTLTEVKDIQSVKINIDGKKSEKMKSGLSLEVEFGRDESMLTPLSSGEPEESDSVNKQDEDGDDKSSETMVADPSPSSTSLAGGKKKKKKLRSAIVNGSATDEQVANASSIVEDGLYNNE